MSSTHFSITSLSSKMIEVILQGAVLGRNGQDLLADVVFKVWLAEIVSVSCLIKPVSRSFITAEFAKIVYEVLTRLCEVGKLLRETGQNSFARSSNSVVVVPERRKVLFPSTADERSLPNVCRELNLSHSSIGAEALYDDVDERFFIFELRSDPA